MRRGCPYKLAKNGVSSVREYCLLLEAGFVLRLSKTCRANAPLWQSYVSVHEDFGHRLCNSDACAHRVSPKTPSVILFDSLQLGSSPVGSHVPRIVPSSPNPPRTEGQSAAPDPSHQDPCRAAQPSAAARPSSDPLRPSSRGAERRRGCSARSGRVAAASAAEPQRRVLRKEQARPEA